MTVWKFVIDAYQPHSQFQLNGYHKVCMPMESKLLFVAEQNDKLIVWAVVNTTRSMVDRQFRVCGTGEELQNIANWDYVGTVMRRNGLVTHVFTL